MAENVLQDVFHELTEAYRLTRPIERVASWLFAVARNKINDWYRKPRPISLNAPLNTGDQMVAELGVPLNALLSRKRYAVLHLRERLRDLYDELNDQ